MNHYQNEPPRSPGWSLTLAIAFGAAVIVIVLHAILTNTPFGG
ncbi:hypothetical protein PLEIONE_258 [Mycobacterium phage Pleione]|uniref:Uncharacterized protein n=2 Tax=Bixzunavirus Bxz1 TaxID=2006134 RepID=R4TL83_9CAUD|nr:hypothetical protein M181_gp102 [Mycobacterium phage Gizmo]YP_009017996.1 hypothetical protein PLEIONE_258 [Mycobacterium phage Pleione]AOZ63103.1 hypothetical protein SEA_YUCCA_255 [Mycobacterium phage Yucca]AOZ63340.1 hypothetical protein SEA_ERDMANN_256 [Mycobacterium phage Erdmann]AYD83172.1 hypothetical protein SEA_BREAD_251 [Mycobacterium phage Bread]AZF95493.1 hypothetical protein SEA_TINYTIM_253 [Mycobacterium phage TinyTim]QYC53478.1 membrane protein [Mycobacterium phage Delylah]